MMNLDTPWIRSSAAAIGAVLGGAMLLSGCAADVDSVSSTAASSPSTASPSAPPQSVASPSTAGSAGATTDEPSPADSGGAAPSVDPAAPVAVQQYDVDGAVVTTLSALDELPEQASVVRFSRMLIDQGDGLRLCINGVEESLPPQCDGPVVVGLDPAGWTETQSGVTWGEREVVVEWPPVDGQLVLIAAGPPNYPQPEDLEFEEPQGSYDLAALEAISDQLSDAGLFGTAGPVTSTGIGAVPGRLDVGLVVADLATIRQVLDAVATPDALHVWGEAEILG